MPESLYRPPPEPTPLVFLYRNWKGETALRTAIPQRVWYGEVAFHNGAQWLLDAFDTEKQALRTFAMCDILEIRRPM